MVVFGHEVPDVMVVKIVFVLAIAALAGAYEGWTGRSFGRKPRTEKPPEPIPGEVKHMGMVDEVPPDQRLP